VHSFVEQIRNEPANWKKRFALFSANRLFYKTFSINDFHAEEAAKKYDLSKKCHAPVAYNMNKIYGICLRLAATQVLFASTGGHPDKICFSLAARRTSGSQWHTFTHTC
jgi:hypothetical protein